MSLNSILSIGVSGLQTAQTGLRVTSDNISNVNTPGYVRKLVDQTSLSFDGRGSGVDVARVRIAIDRYLQGASLKAASEAARAGATAELYDRAQSYFGDPSKGADFFSRLDGVFAAFSAAADDSSSAPARQQALTAVQGFFSEADRIGQGLNAVRQEADARIGSAVARANELLQQIEQLNQDISRQTVAGRDSSGAQGQQALLVDELSKLMDVRIQERPQGGLNLRTTDGTLLAGQGAATLSGGGAAGELYITPAGGTLRPLLDHLQSGEIKGLVELRDRELTALGSRLAEFVDSAAAAVNKAHNAASAVPAPATLTGRNTGLDLPTAIGGFTGRTTVAITDAAGAMARRVDIDFDAGTMSVDGGAPSAFTPASFLGGLNAALSPLGSASFADGALSLSAAGGRGMATADDPAAPTAKAGKGFSEFFGLNDLLRSNGYGDGATGLRPTDPHGFTPGQTITFRLTSASGAVLRDVTAAVPAGGTMADLLNGLNSASSGLGVYGAFALDADGRLGFSPSTSAGIGVTVASDGTSRGTGGPSLSALFRLDSGGSATPSWTLRSDVKADPKRLSLAQLDTGAPLGGKALAIGDTRGGLALASAGEAAAPGAASLIRRAADFSGFIGASAQAALNRADAAAAVSAETAQQRSASEGVNLDEELVKLTTYQQAFNASSRLIQAAKDMYDVLLQMT